MGPLGWRQGKSESAHDARESVHEEETDEKTQKGRFVHTRTDRGDPARGGGGKEQRQDRRTDHLRTKHQHNESEFAGPLLEEAMSAMGSGVTLITPSSP